MAAHHKHSSHFRTQFLQAERAGRSVLHICNEFKISRKTYYKWKKIFEKENTLENRARGRKKTVDVRIEKIVLDLIKIYPNWSVDKLYTFLKENNNNEQLVSRHWIQLLLQRNKLSTLESRTKFSYQHQPTAQTQIIAPQIEVTPAINKQRVLHATDASPPAPAFDHLSFTSATSFAQSLFSKQTVQELQHTDKVYLSATAFVSIINAYLFSRIINAVIMADTLGAKIGTVFSSIALFCGLFFFIYSVKYYITIAAVLLKSRTQNTAKSSTSQLIESLFMKVSNLPWIGNIVSEWINKNNRPDTDPVSLHKQVQEMELTEYPFFSVQIPLYNEKKVANRVTTAAASMEYPNFEVLVCDDSTDETTQLLYDKWSGSDKVRILHRTNRSGFKGAALDNALKVMDPRTEYVVVFDADFVPYPDTLTLFAKYFKVIAENERNNVNTLNYPTANQLVKDMQAGQYAGKTVAVQGYQWHVLNKSENWITRAVRSEFAGSYIIERSGGQVFGLLKQIAGSVYAINASVLKEVGWGTSITEDFQLTLKLYEQGYKVAYTPYIQAPSECVSTLKRLIRQRQRWAEGHSFNIKKQLLTMLRTPNMTVKEKWEAVYLTPYYLQAFIFILGSVCWIIAETILRVKLPFWTSALGWSLVLTNLFSLPLMNTIGLFLEEGEERDYLGIFSFITLCYVLAPFIGFAALKGFLEKEEGPWFRTPKSGHITDKINRAGERKRDRISRYIPWIKPIVGVLNTIIPEKQYNEVSPYLAYATASNGFNNFAISNKGSKLKKRLMHFGLVIAFAITAIANIAQTTVPQAFANPDTYYMKTTTADNLTDAATDKRLQGSTTIGASTTTQTVSSTNPTLYMITDNLNKRWTADTEINDSNTTGERRNVAIATSSTGDTTAVWEDSRNTDATQNKFTTTTGGLVRGRYTYGASALIDGRALITGGFSDNTAVRESSAEIYDPVTDTFSLLTVGMTSQRARQAQITLNDGRVLIVGGRNNSSVQLSSAELYDPNANAFAATTAMTVKRENFTLVKLNNGKVLAAGGSNGTNIVSSVEIYDPTVATWTVTGTMADARSNYGIQLLQTGEVLITGGKNDAGSLSSTEIYDPVTGTWRRSGYTNAYHSGSSVTMTLDGKVLIAGGSDAGTYLSSTELYDPSSDTWTALSNLASDMASETQSILLPNGKVLIKADYNASGPSTAEVYDPLTQTIAYTTGFLNARRQLTPGIQLPNGEILFAGGQQVSASLTTAETFNPVTYDIYAQKYDKTGAKLWNSGTDIRVNTDDGNRVSTSGPPNYNHLNPSVALDSSGNAVIAWEEQRDGVFNTSVWSQKLQSSDGTKLWPMGTKNSFAPAPGALAFARGSANKSGTTATTLNNGKILVVGTNVANNGQSTAELYDVSARTYSNVKTIQKRNDHSATPLLNGRVLIAGGDVTAATASSAEVYEPTTNTFVATTGFIASGRARHTATLLKNGKVILIGGLNGGSGTITTTSIFDPVTNTFSAGPNTAYVHVDAASVMLPNGKVLVVGDSQGGPGNTAAELFDPLANTFSKVPGAHIPKAYNGLVLLNNGKALSVGPQVGTNSTSEIYDPVLNTWSTTGNMLVSKQDLNLILLPNGKVLSAGGWDLNPGSESTESELFDPAANTWTATTNNLTSGRNYAYNAYSPINNKIYVVGGSAAGLTTAESFTPIADMPVSTYDYKQNEVYVRTNLGSVGVISNKKPKVAINSSDDATIAWQDDKIGKFEFKGNAYGFVNTAFNMFGANPGALGQCTNGGGCSNASTMMAPPVQVVAQKICNQASCGIAGTTSGERQWGNDQTNFNKNNPDEKQIANIKNAMNVNIVSDGTSMAAIYESDSGSVNQSTRTKKIYMQKLDVNGTTTLSNPWTANASNMTSARYQNTATLMNSGTMLLAGGEDNNGVGLSSAEVFNPQTGTFAATSNNMTIGRMNHTATLLSNGQILVAGGGSAAQVGSSSANLYNPATNTFTATTGNMIGNRTGHTATLLRNGRVLIAGGKNGTSATYLSSAETFNPATGTFTAITGNINAARAGHAATLLPDGRVMMAGGGSSTTVLAVVTANAYDPVAGTSAALSSMAIARSNFTLTLLNNGKVLAVGGFNNSSVRLSSAEIYDPLANTWSTTSSLRTGIRSDHAATLLPNGQVLITGGYNGTNNVSTAELYDPVTGTFTATSNLNSTRAYHTNVVTPDGKVYIMGGASSPDTTTTTSATTAGTASAGTNWTTTSGTLQAAFATSDNIYGIFNNAGQNPEFLSNFGFSIPSNGNILGITGTVEGNGTDATAANRQFRAGISKDASTIVGTERSAQALPQTTDSNVVMPTTGGTLDTWGVDSITPAEVNSANFGIRIRDNDTTAAALNFDRYSMTITYSTNSTVLSSAEMFNLNQQVSTADSTDSKNPDLVKDSSGNYQAVWQAWRSEGLSPGTGGGSWKVMSQEINNPSTGAITKQYPTGTPSTWAAAATMSVDRSYPTAITMANGKVLVAGGDNQAGDPLSTAEVYDPTANTWTATTNRMAHAHDYGTGVANLSNGQTLVFGGSVSGGGSAAELFNPYTNTWSTTGNMRSYRAKFGSAITLNNNKVLVAGGTDFITIKSSSELYDPSTGTWTLTTGNMTGLRMQHQMVKLNNGYVLAIGGCTSDASCTSNVLTTVEMFNPNTNTWSVINGLNTARVGASVNLLNSGKVLIMGGQTTGAANLSSAEIFDPATQTWSTLTANMPNNAVNDVVQAISTVLPNGKVLITRGYKGVQSYLFNPVTETWSSTGSLTTGRGGQGITLMKTGKVLVVGGYDSVGFTGQSSTEIYTPELSEMLVSTDDSSRNFNQTEPKISADSASGYSYVGWTDDRLTSPSDTTNEQNIYMQKLDGSGNPSWPNGLNENGTYNVHDIRIDTTRGSFNTTSQSKVAIAKSVFTNTATDVPVQLAWTDNRDGTPTTSIYGQSYNTRNNSMSTTNWTAYYYVTGSPSSANSINVQVGIAEENGETMSYTSASSLYTGDGTNGQKSTLFTNLPATGDTSLTNRRLVMKITTNAGSMQIQYNGASTVADTRLDVGIVVPERSLLLVLIIPALPLIAIARKKSSIKKMQKVAGHSKDI